MRQLVEAAAGYRKMFGWPVRAIEDATVLTPDERVGGIRIPAAYGPRLIDVLAEIGGDGPVVEPVDSQLSWVFFADPHGSNTATPLPPDVRLLTRDDRIPLPVGPWTPAASRWVAIPAAGRPLPALDTVLEGVAAVCRACGRKRLS